MSKPGPRPKPTKILELNNSWRKDKNKREPKPDSLHRYPAPAWLKKNAKDAWHKLEPILNSVGLLTVADVPAFERYCVLWGRWRELEEFIKKNGQTYTVKDKSGKKVIEYKAYPHVLRAERLAQILVRLEEQFGLTPSSRSRIELSFIPSPTAPPRKKAGNGKKKTKKANRFTR